MVIDVAISAGCTTPGPIIPDAEGTDCWSEGDVFTDVRQSGYWTSSHDRYDRWVADLRNGTFTTGDRDSSRNFAWAVRSGP